MYSKRGHDNHSDKILAPNTGLPRIETHLFPETLDTVFVKITAVGIIFAGQGEIFTKGKGLFIYK